MKEKLGQSVIIRVTLSKNYLQEYNKIQHRVIKILHIDSNMNTYHNQGIQCLINSSL
ncbi:MAG: hypothetical protein ACJAY1_001834 [Glaciecola sp.]|jgi:hypothetical protein